MINIAYDDIQTWDDCITPTEWNNMITYINGLPTSMCSNTAEVTFYLYTDCEAGTGQEFKFSVDGDDSIIEGDDTSGQDLILKANTADTYPFIELEGDDDIYLDIADSKKIIFREDGNQFFIFNQDGDDSIIKGSANTNDDLIVRANSADIYPYMIFHGDAGFNVNINTGFDIKFHEATTEIFRFKKADNFSYLYGGAVSGKDLVIQANSVDSFPYISMYGNEGLNLNIANDDEIIFKEGGSQFFLFDHSDDDSKLYGGDASGEDLFIYANSYDNCPIIELFGNSGISNKIKSGSIFDVSTCSNETLFEIDSGSPMNVNFHCLEAFEFRLENRTSDPSGPTCIGRMWFRTDL